jgi:hypothetical protein
MQIWNPVTHQPVWYVLLILGAASGVIFGHLLRSLFHMLSYYLWRKWRCKCAIEGRWHSYHWTHKGKPTLIHSIVTIKKGIKEPYIAILEEQFGCKLLYEGKIIHERGHFIIHFTSRVHAETLVCRFPDPLGTECDRIFGLWLGYDHDKIIASAGILLSKIEVNEPERTISEGVEIYTIPKRTRDHQKSSAANQQLLRVKIS